MSSNDQVKKPASKAAMHHAMPVPRKHHERHSEARFPSQQLFILALCRICEPIAFMSIFPYVYQMIRCLEPSAPTRTIGIYVGLVTSAFAFAEFSSGMIWGRISDRIGRKPVLLAGLAGTSISMLLFGFAPNLVTALLGRAVGGLLNGNLGVLQTTVAELVTHKEHQPRAYSIMPSVWCLGSILGPVLGGALAQPHQQYPSLFVAGSFFDRHAFLLPNLVCSSILCLGVLVGILFLEETHPVLKTRHDPGLHVGNWISTRLMSTSPGFSKSHYASILDEKHGSEHEQSIGMLEREKDSPPRYSEVVEETSPQHVRERLDVSDQSPMSSKPFPFAKQDIEGLAIGAPPASAGIVFTGQVILVIGALGILAFHSISFDQLMPIFLSEPVSRSPTTLPFHSTGGFGFSTKRIGLLMSIQGIYSIIAQLFFFPFVARRFGVLATFQTILVVWPILYLLVPYLVLLPSGLQQPAIILALLTKITFHVLAFPSTAILLANATPSMLVLGLVNGMAASTASLARAFGPTVTGLLHSWGLQLGSNALAWWVSALICAIGAVESRWLIEPSQSTADKSDSDRPDRITSKTTSTSRT